jgi:hypothetical protein
MVQNRTELSAAYAYIYKIDPARARKQLRCKFHSGGNLAQDPEPFQFACFLHIIAPSSWTHVAMLFCWLPANLHSLANALHCAHTACRKSAPLNYFCRRWVERQLTTYIYSSSLFFTSHVHEKISRASRAAAGERQQQAQKHHKDGPKKNGSLDSLILLHTHSLTHSLGKARSSAQEREDSN